MNLAGTGADGLPAPIDFVYVNTPSDIPATRWRPAAAGLGPSVAVFEPGFLRVVLAYHRAGRLPAGTLVKLYFPPNAAISAAMRRFSAPPIREAFDLYLAMLRDATLRWAVAVLGGSLLDSPIAALALDWRTSARRPQRPPGRQEQPRRGRARESVRERAAGGSRRPPKPRRCSTCRVARGVRT